VNRRHVLGLIGGAAVATGIGVPFATGIAGSTSTGRQFRSALRLPKPFTRPLTVPRVLDAAAGPVSIVQRPGMAEILPGIQTPIWGYGGEFPGPTIRARSGRPAIVEHHNDLPVPVVVHLHGGHTPPGDDGYPTDVLPLGGIRRYTYPGQQRAATLWYHDHRMDATGQSVWRGLAGFHLIGDDEDDALPLPRAERDLPLLIADRAFAADGSLAYPQAAEGVLGDVITVNGRAWPYAEVAGARYRVRLLNASNARRYRLALDPPGAIVQIGSDGGLLGRPVTHDAVELAPGERVDAVVDFGRYRPGSAVRLVNTFGSGSTRDVMRFQVGSRAADDSTVPARLSTVDPLPTPTRTRTFRFHAGGVHGMKGWLVNGEPFRPGVPVARPRLGDTEVWELTSDLHHPVHVHLGQFQVLGRGIRGPGTHDAGWKDTIDLRPAEQARIAVRFTGYTGRYLLHCHNLEHEDMAMMAEFETTR
jgi:spore coat protein A